MADQFEHHGIAHLSASSINLFRNEPALWVVRYLFKVKDDPSPAMQRGIDTENAVYDRIMGRENDYAPDVVERIHSELLPYGELVSYQRKLEYKNNSLLVPIIGFLDFEFESACVDLKTKSKMASTMDYDHRLQAAFYLIATGKDQHFLYATDKKCQMAFLDSPGMYVNQIIGAGISIQNFLSKSKDPKELAHMIFPNLSNFRWGENSKKFAEELWEI